MKKPFSTFMAVLATVFLLAGCTKDEAMHQTYFYNRSSSANEPLTLFVDGQARGQLPALGSALTCQNDTLKSQALQLNLKSGKYWLEAKNSQGAIKSSTSLKITEGGLGMKGGVGNNAGGSDGMGCVTVNLYY